MAEVGLLDVIDLGLFDFIGDNSHVIDLGFFDVIGDSSHCFRVVRIAFVDANHLDGKR